jgi:tRNA pseudouridine38-40 synthase
MSGAAKKRVLIQVAYDGSDYCGWQLQTGVPTIEQVLNDTLTELLGEPITVIGASRTDTGVHSLGSVAVFDTTSRIPPEKISYALNQRLPDDIVVQSSYQVADDFHPRHCDSVKTYEYRILNREFPLPTERKTSFFYYRKLDVSAMAQAAALFVGTHDFASFCSAHSQVQSTVRTVTSCTVEKEGDMIHIRVSGTGFLYNMVRILAGTLIEIGYEARVPEDMSRILAARTRSAAGPTAPAHGLTMVGIKFLENPCISAKN